MVLIASAGEALRTYEVDLEGGKLQPTEPPGFQTLPITVPPVLKRQVCSFGSVIYPHFERIHLPLDFGGFTLTRRSILEIHKPSLNQPQHDRKDHRGRNPEQERSICRFEWPEQPAGRRHNDIAVTQRRVIDRGVAKGGSEVCKFSADHEQHPPKRRSLSGVLRTRKNTTRAKMRRSAQGMPT